MNSRVNVASEVHCSRSLVFDLFLICVTVALTIYMQKKFPYTRRVIKRVLVDSSDNPESESLSMVSQLDSDPHLLDDADLIPTRPKRGRWSRLVLRKPNPINLSPVYQGYSNPKPYQEYPAPYLHPATNASLAIEAARTANENLPIRIENPASPPSIELATTEKIAQPRKLKQEPPTVTTPD